jgi:putative spermidine/putrescine transport system ATP-binding protein
LVFEPDALLLDEPLGALDRKLREQLQTEIKDIQRRVGISILFVTHDQDEAMLMSDQIAVMNGGEIVQIGTPADVYQHPETEFVAGFLGETNVLPVTVLAIDSGHAVVRFADGSQGRVRLPRGTHVPAIGATSAVSIRPERIRFLAPDASADHVTDGILTSQVFLGRHARSTVQAMAQALIVTSPDPAPADRLRLGWDSAAAQLLAPTPTSPI